MPKKINSVLLLTALLLSVICSALPLSAAAVDGLGNIHMEVNEKLAPGLDYSELYATSDSGRQHAFVYTYTPGGGTALKLAWGDTIIGRDALSDLAASAIDDGYDVVGGINADFFSMQTGVPLSVMIYNGKLISSDAGGNALGVTSSGSAFIGKPGITLTLTGLSGYEYKISHFNKYPTIYNSYLLTRDYCESTKSTSESREIVIRLDSGAFTLNSTVTGTVTDVLENATDSEIPEGCAVLSINNSSALLAGSEQIKKGDVVSITVSCAAEWTGVDFAVGGGDVLLSNGSMPDGIVDEDHEKRANPRSAVGITADGKLIFYAADGRDTTLAIGQTLAETAQTLKALGCVSALNLDGGGSTCVAVKHPYSSAVEIAGKPSDGTERRISNAVLFVNTAQPTDIPYEIAVSPSVARVHAGGGSVTLDGIIRDSAYKIIDRDFSDINITYTIASGGGYIEGDTYYAGETADSTTITASANIDGTTVSGSAVIEVVTALDDFSASSSEYTLPAGSTAQLSLNGYKTGLPVNVSSSNFTWKFIEESESELADGAVAVCSAGYIDRSGVFHANADAPSQTLTLAVTYGYKTVYIKINIGMKPEMLNDFEDNRKLTDIFTSDNDTSLIYVNNGKRSDKALGFTGTSLAYNTPKTLLYPIKKISMWVNGDIGSVCYARAINADGLEVELYYNVAEDYTNVNGWRLLEAIVPETISQPLVIVAPFVSLTESNLTIDSITVNYGDDSDTFGDIEGSWAKDYINAIYNMEISDGEIIGGKRFYSPDKNLTRAQFAKLLAGYLSLTSSDTSDSVSAFTDLNTIPEWALPYIRAVVDAGMMSGKLNGDGSVKFAWEAEITRAEVMQVFGKLTDVEPSADFSFTDALDIPAWALENVKKTVAAGIVTGYSDNTVRPNKYVTRAEIAAIFARMNDKAN